ncbi:MAG: glutathione S-transferase N-terminal domain-containing protein [Parachlamydiales bacterium]|nr:glutathione S-transferase N-terminal domain-containing protein [Parachlamydiales bacterium]
MESLTLYYFESCPYCQKVLHYLEEHPVPIEKKDIRKDPAARNELIQIGGKPQVPCLIHDGKALYESDDIIVWLKYNT